MARKPAAFTCGPRPGRAADRRCKMAGAEGLEPSVPVLETGGLPVNRHSHKHKAKTLFGGFAFFVNRLSSALFAKLIYFYFVVFLFAFCKIIIFIFALGAGKNVSYSFCCHFCLPFKIPKGTLLSMSPLGYYF